MHLGMPILYEFSNIEDNFKLAKKLDFNFVELNLNFDNCRKLLENKKEFFRMYEKYNLDFTLHYFDEADFGSYDEVCDAYYKILKKYLKYSLGKIKILNIHLIAGPVVTISGVKNYIYEADFNNYINRLLKNLIKVRDLCNKYKIKLVIENSKTVSYMEKTYVELIKNKFLFNFDIGHDKCNNDILYKISQDYKMSFSELHIHDSDAKLDHLSLGEGSCDIAYFKKLGIKNDAYMLLEVKSSTDLAKSREIFEKL